MSRPLSPAYVLHSRPYRDTSALVDLFTLHQGLQRAVWRGARGQRKGLVPQAFMPLMVATTGRGDLKTLTQAEAAGSYVLLQGDALFSGMYLNELLIRLVYPGDPQPVLFAAYQHALEQLAGNTPVEPVLRQFEWQLLDGLGYGFSLTVDGTGQPVSADARYVWQAEQGLLALDSGNSGGVPGSALLAMAAHDWREPQTLRAAKQLMRQALAPHLGDRPLISRSLFTRHPFIAKGDLP